jgi:mono/diheme cytochrome c family protein
MQRRNPQGAKRGWPILLLSLGLLLGMTACDSGPDWGMPASAKDVPNPVPPTAQSLAAAGAIYADRCARCHGERGAGDGADASLYKPLPASLTDEQTRQTSDGELFWKIGKGRRPMPGYGSELTAEQRWQLVNLLRTFAASAAARPAAEGAAPAAR